MAKILYADDDPKYQRLVKIFLSRQGYEVITASDGLKLLELFDKHKDTDAILLDVMMPHMDGRETCKTIREFSDVPILMVTALGDLHNEILAFDKGADDYISKPFSNEKLLVRIKSLLRRTSNITNQIFCEEGFTFEDSILTVTAGSDSIVFTPKEYLLFQTLLKNKNLVLSRDQLLDRVWGLGFDGDARTVDSHVKGLRNKLGEFGNSIKTFRGKGYSYRSINHEKSQTV